MTYLLGHQTRVTLVPYALENANRGGRDQNRRNFAIILRHAGRILSPRYHCLITFASSAQSEASCASRYRQEPLSRLVSVMSVIPFFHSASITTKHQSPIPVPGSSVHNSSRLARLARSTRPIRLSTMLHCVAYYPSVSDEIGLVPHTASDAQTHVGFHIPVDCHPTRPNLSPLAGNTE